MFSVYGVTGRVFKGAMEELRQVTAVGAVARTRGIEPLSPQVMPETTAGSTASHAAASAGRRSPLAAYAQAGAAQTQRHPLSKVVDVMSRGVTSVPADMPVLDAWQLLAAAGRTGAGAGASGRRAGLAGRPAHACRPAAA